MSLLSHSNASFLNSCLKTPIDPCNRCPAPGYNRPFVYLGKDCQKEVAKKKKKGRAKCSKAISNSDEGTSEAIWSLAKFYDSIPDYREVNHLPKEEFYSTLDRLKEACSILKTKPNSCHRIISSSLSCSDVCSEATVSSKKTKTKSNGSSTGSKKKKKPALRKAVCNKPPSPLWLRNLYEKVKFDRYREDEFPCLNEQMSCLNIEEQHEVNIKPKMHAEFHCQRGPPLKKSQSFHDLKEKWERIEEESPSPPPIERSSSSYFPRKVYCDDKIVNTSPPPPKTRDFEVQTTIRVDSPKSESIKSVSIKKGKTKRKESCKVPFSFLGLDVDTKKQPNSANCSPSPVHPVARPNLAATLRVETCRRKIKKMQHNCTFRDVTTPQVDWEVRNTPAWKSLSFNESHKNILSMRLATRRAEQRLQESEYNLNMELMRQRVKSAPLLLEGTTYWGPKVGKLTHTCYNENVRHVCPHTPGKRKSKKVKPRKIISRNSDISTNLNSDDLNSVDRAYL